MLKLENKRYSDETLSLAKQVTATGFNIWQMFGKWRKISKMKPDIPDEVIKKVCQEYLKRLNL